MKLRFLALSLSGHLAVLGALWVARPLCVTPKPPDPEPIFFELVEEESPAAEEEAPEARKETPTVREEAPEARKETLIVQQETIPEVHEEAPEALDETLASQKDVSANREESPIVSKEPPVAQEEKAIVQNEAETPGTVERAKVVAAPQALGRLTPVYPRNARRRHHEGFVSVEAVVREDGTVGEVRVVSSSGHDDLDGAAVRAVRTAAFQPATEDGVAVSGRIRLSFEFRLD